MVTFRSVSAIVLLAAYQVAHMSAAPVKLPLCKERPELGNSYKGYNLGFFHQDTTEPRGRFIADNDPQAIIQVQLSHRTQKYITTVQTGDIGTFNGHLALSWTMPDGKPSDSRFFELEPHHKCRVQHSAQYAKLNGGSYI